MSSDYEKGYAGEPGVNNLEYQRGQQDSHLATPRPGGEASTHWSTDQSNTSVDSAEPSDLSGVRAAGVQFGEQWVIDPDRTLRGALGAVVGFTVLGALLGVGHGTVLGGEGLWLGYAKVFFWLASFLTGAMILGVTLVGRGTRRGTLTLLFLGSIVAYMVWVHLLGG